MRPAVGPAVKPQEPFPLQDPIRQERSTEVVFFRPSSTPLSAESQACAKSLFDAVEALLPADGQNLFGEWSIADVDLALMLNRPVMNGDEVPQRPSVQRWVKLAR